MTLTKQTLGEALALNRSRNPNHEYITDTAARFVERLLPEKCGCMSQHPDVRTSHLFLGTDCHGTSQLWDEGLKDAIALALYGTDYDGCGIGGRSRIRAVLAALAEEVGRG